LGRRLRRPSRHRQSDRHDAGYHRDEGGHRDLDDDRFGEREVPEDNGDVEESGRFDDREA
jgi:hypothetical protein